LKIVQYAAHTGSSPVSLAKKVNIALSSDYWVFGIVINIILTIALQCFWESLPIKNKEMVVITMLTIIALLAVFAASEGLV